MHESMALKYMHISSHHFLRIIKIHSGFWSGQYVADARKRNLPRPTQVKMEAYGENAEISGKQSTVRT